MYHVREVPRSAAALEVEALATTETYGNHCYVCGAADPTAMIVVCHSLEPRVTTDESVCDRCFAALPHLATNPDPADLNPWHDGGRAPGSGYCCGCADPVTPAQVLVYADSTGCEGPAADPYHLACYLRCADTSLPSNLALRHFSPTTTP